MSSCAIGLIVSVTISALESHRFLKLACDASKNPGLTRVGNGLAATKHATVLPGERAEAQYGARENRPQLFVSRSRSYFDT
jgi:hypothetical protein